MSMTYYAVTDDPNELAHFGIKGMKWGVRHDRPRHSGSRRRSAAYKRASGKLSKLMKSGIKKAEANWKTYNSPAAKYERQTNRAIQAARKGKLKYNKLTDEQVRRVTERLNLERQARQLSDTEPTFRHRLAKSIGEGVVTGIGSGVGRRMSEWISRGSTLKTDRLRAEQQDEFDRAKEKRRIKNAEKEAIKKAEREFNQQQRKDAYEYERDRQREAERVRNLYEYGAAYDKEGKLDYTDRDRIESYYQKRYLNGETRTASRIRQERESGQHAREAERERRQEYNRGARERARERKVIARENRHALRRADEELKRETTLKRFDEKYERQMERQAKRDAQRTQRLLSGEERARIDHHNTSNRRKRRGR